MRVENWPLDRLAAYPNNPRKISDKAVAKVASSIAEYGFRQPIVVDDQGVIVVGHTRLLAAKSLGIEAVPVHVAKGLSAQQIKAYRLADNRTNDEAAWDLDLLGVELDGLDDFDLSLTGFDPGEIDRLRGPSGGLSDEDDAPAVPEAPVSRLGDLWCCGAHRVLCGDATSADDVAAVMGDAKPHLMVTDPPYGVEYDPDWRNRADRANGVPYGARAIGEVPGDDRTDWVGAWDLFTGDVAYCWTPSWYISTTQRSLEGAGLNIRSLIIWAKARFVISRGHYHWKHEPCWYAVRKGRTAHWHGDRSQTTVWDIEHRKSETGHSTQKPVECMRRPIQNNSAAGDAVYDPFLGSGTTMIAAETTGRVCHGLEIDPAYVDVAVQRWQAFTGQEATCEGMTFDQAAQEPGAPAGKD